MASNNKAVEKAVTINQDIGLLGSDSRFEGTIRFEGTLRIDGTVIGNIESGLDGSSMLVINKDAVILGDVTADSILISGKVEGMVHAPERVELYRAGFLKGDIYTGDLMVEAGASFEGYCHMNESPPSVGKKTINQEGRTREAELKVKKAEAH